MRTPWLLLTLAGCVGSTGGERVVFDAVAAPRAPLDEGGGAVTWTDPRTGFTITLTEAAVWTGPVYLWSDEPLVDVGAASLLDVVVPVARAATDQFVAGFLTGELTTQTRVDLLGGADVPLGAGDGLAGPSRSAEVWLEPVASDVTAPTLHARGVATSGVTSIPFSVDVTFDEAWAPDGTNIAILRRVRGLPWDVELTDGGTLTVGIDVRRWFDDADFATLPDEATAEDGVFPVGPDTSVGRALFHDVRRLAVDGPWSLSFTP